MPQCYEINEDHLRALGENGEECRFLHAQAFVKQNGTKLNRDKGRHPLVLEYADLPDTLVLHEGLKIVITKNVDQQRGIVNATCGLVRRWEDTAASLEAEIQEQDVDHKRPAWVEVELTTGKGKDSTVKIQPFEDKGVWVPYCRG